MALIWAIPARARSELILLDCSIYSRTSLAGGFLSDIENGPVSPHCRPKKAWKRHNRCQHTMGLPIIHDEVDHHDDMVATQHMKSQIHCCLNSLVLDCCSRLTSISDERDFQPGPCRLILYTRVKTDSITSTHNREALKHLLFKLGVVTNITRLSFICHGTGRLLLACRLQESREKPPRMANCDNFGHPQFTTVLSEAEFDRCKTLLADTEWQARWSCYALSARWLAALETLDGLA